MHCSVVTDSAANLPLRIILEYGITVVPLSYYTEDAENVCVDVDAFDGKSYYGKMRGGAVVTTSQAPPERYVETIEPLLAAGEDVMFVSVSSGISGAFSSARLALMQLAERYPRRKIRLVDTRGVSLGEGLLVIRAAQLLRDGASPDEAALRIRELRERMCQIFTVDDLMYLRRSGRLPHASALLATLLRIKPLFLCDERGRISDYAKVSGRRRALEALAERYDECAAGAEGQTVGIAEADCPEDAQDLCERIRRLHPPKEILTVPCDPVIGAHVGPGALALFFLGGENARSR